MKKLLFLFGVLLIAISFHAQNAEQRSCLTVGGGKESYNGHLGNSWFDPGEEWYGFFQIGYSHYLNKSFDISAHVSYGDIGRCRADGADPAILNLYARMTSGALTLRYKFANGYLLNENAKVAPYLFFGGGENNMEDIWTHNRVNSGNFTSVHGGLGCLVNLNTRINIGYSTGFAYLTSSSAFDYIVSGKHDCYMQHTFTVGYNF